MEKTSIKIVKILQKAGHEAYWAGGSVRDMLLGVDPKDYDIVTSAKPDEIEDLLERLKRSKKRPLLQKKNVDDAVKKIYLERKKFYNEADYKVKCSSMKSGEIVEKILKLYENSRN